MVIGFESDEIKNEKDVLLDSPEHYKNSSSNYSSNNANYQAYDTSCFRDFNYTEIENKREIWIDEEMSDSLEQDMGRKYQTYVKNLCRFGSGVIYVPDDFHTIQSAVENATAGDEIIVRNGTYTENIVVDKPLTVRSEEGYTNCTILLDKSTKHIFTITSDFVTISGFKMKGKEEYGRSAVLINNYVNYSTISWNKLIYCFYFIKGKYTNNNTIHDNFMGAKGSYCENWGIWLEHNSNNHIYNNEIKHLDQYAVSIHCKKGNNNLIENNILRGSYCVGLVSATNNTILDNDMGTGFWAQMYIENSHNNQIINNTFPTARTDGIILQSSDNNNISDNVFQKSGIYVYESYNNTIKNNTVRDKPLIFSEGETGKIINEDAGQIILVLCDNITIVNQNISETIVGVEFFNTSNSMIRDSIIKSNKWEGIYSANSNNNKFHNITLKNSWQGITLYDCNENEISSCKINPNSWEGIYFKRSHLNNICNNTISGRDCNGIELHNSNNNTICCNVIILHRYGFGGLFLYNSNSNLCYHNTFYKNSNDAFDDGDNKWDNGYPSGGNYWDAYYGIDINGDGIGDISFVIPGGSNKDFYPLMCPPNNVSVPPKKPDISGTKIGGVGKDYKFTFSAIDPNGDDVYLKVEWGNRNQKWMGPYGSGEEVVFNNTWDEKGSYYIRARARDINDIEGPWSEFKVTMPKSRDMWFLRWLEKFPILQRLLEVLGRV